MTVPDADLLYADDRPHQRGLAAAAGPEQAGDAAGRDRAVQAVQHAALAAVDDQVVDAIAASMSSGLPKFNGR